jgi:putative transposase
MGEDNIKIKRRHLPHWTLTDATYFITFNCMRGDLSIECQILTLDVIKEGNNKYYTLIACIVMPGHVHVILTPHEGYTLTRIMKGMKGKSARLINNISALSGSIWQNESYDRIIRDRKELLNKINYIINNPVKKGLTDDPINYHGLYLNNDIW